MPKVTFKIVAALYHLGNVAIDEQRLPANPQWTGNTSYY